LNVLCAACGEPPLLLAASVYFAAQAAIKEARKQMRSWGCIEQPAFNFQVPAIMPTVKELCGLDSVERYLQWKIGSETSPELD
jgi:abscisic-aldehyde oxidase